MSANPSRSGLSYLLRAKALGLYLMALLVLYLAGSYLGSLFLFCFYLLFLAPLLSLLHLFITLGRLRYHQQFSTEHPIKGQTVIYKLSLANESLLPNPHLRVRFKTINPMLEPEMANFSAYLRPRERLENAYHIHCPYRGIYTVGLEWIEQEDLLHFFRIRLPVWYRTFYVYPRILALRQLASGPERSERRAQGASSGAAPDYSLFRQLRAYRPGEPVRHLSWKKFAGTGFPFIKQFETTAEPGVTLYLELRQRGQGGALLDGKTALATEDASIEILVALVKHFLDRGIATAVRAPGRRVYAFRGEDPASFSQFYNSTFELMFQDTYSPLNLYRSEWKNRLVESASVIVITHLLDPDLVFLIEESLGSANRLTVIFNQAGYGEAGKARLLRIFNRLRDRGARILMVNSAQSMVEDLEGLAHA